VTGLIRLSAFLNGGGVRRCIGMAFAQFEMKLVISGILSGFELALADSRSIRPVRRGLTAGPSPFRMVVKEHRPAKPVQIRQDSLIIRDLGVSPTRQSSAGTGDSKSIFGKVAHA
jgi:hypothetical protein